MSDESKLELRILKRRRTDLLLTALTAALFLGFLLIITAFPTQLSASSIIFLGFLLVLYSVGATLLYQSWVDRLQQSGDDK